MGIYTQANRPISVSTPLGPDTLLLISVAGEEALSALFRFELEMLAIAHDSVPFDQVLGQSVTVTLVLPDGSTRPINGIVSSFCQAEVVAGPQGRSTFIRYHAELVPRLWLLTKTFQSRIFQQMTIPDILKQVLAGLDVSFQIQGTFQPREYCVQYRESDFQFASRLMEEEGIYYYFEHTASGHTMVVANTPWSHADVPGPTPITFETVAGGTRSEARITDWKKRQEVRSGKYTLRDYCFAMPRKNLEAIQRLPQSVQVGTVTHNLRAANNSNLEIYDYPGDYAKRFDGIDAGGGEKAANLQNIFTDNDRTADIRMQEEGARAVTITGRSGCQQLAAGHKFELHGHFNADGPYVLTKVNHRAELKGAYTTGEETPFEYGNTFECIPFSYTYPFRPARTTPRAQVEGLQTAVVVGPAGEEIFCDKYGRVKVQFHWDRQGQLDANSSCWLRVSQPLAGQGWGMITIPRVGQEVVVAFLEGDPDRPIITGSVFNAVQMPPFTLPDYRTRTSLKSHSYNNGDQDNFHGIVFEDTKGSEHLQIHSEKDMMTSVEHSKVITVGHDHHLHVGSSFLTTVGGFQKGSGSGGGNGDGGSGSGGGDGMFSWTSGNVSAQVSQSLALTYGVSTSAVAGLSLAFIGGFQYDVVVNPLGFLGELVAGATGVLGNVPRGFGAIGGGEVYLTLGSYSTINYGTTLNMLRGTVVNVIGNPYGKVMRAAAAVVALVNLGTMVAVGGLDPNNNTWHTPVDWTLTALSAAAWTTLFTLEAVFVGEQLFSIQTDNLPSAALYVKNTDILSVVAGLTEATTGLAANDKMESADNKENKNLVHQVENAFIVKSTHNVQTASTSHCIVAGSNETPLTRSSVSMDPDKVLVQYGVPDLGPAVRMDSDGIFLGVGPAVSGASITLHPTEGITLQAGPAVSITLHPTNGITLQAGPAAGGSTISLHPINGITLQAGRAATGATISLHPINGITLNFGPNTSLKLQQAATFAKYYNYFCQVQTMHSTKASLLEESIQGSATRTAGIVQQT